jgi:hypothetical protein
MNNEQGTRNIEQGTCTPKDDEPFTSLFNIPCSLFDIPADAALYYPCTAVG